MSRSTRALLFVIFVFGPVLGLYNSCAVGTSNSGTILGNPLTSMSIKSYSGQYTSFQLSAWTVCVNGITLTTSTSQTVQIAYSNVHELTVPSEGANLDSLALPYGSYTQLQLQLSDQCLTQRSIGVVNTQGTFNNAQTLNLSFSGNFTIDANTSSVLLDAQAIVNQLSQATSNNDTATQATAAAGDVGLGNIWSSSLSTTNAPAARGHAMAVWTGSKVIVWGGQNASWLNTGGQYNPSTDTWTATSTGANVLPPTWESSYVWTGSKMVIWSGQSLTTDGALYDPVADTWTPMSTASAPPPRHSPATVWTGTQMLVWGGTNGSAAINTGGAYDPSTDTWTTIPTTGAPPAAAFQDHNVSAVWTGTEMLVWGGDGAGDHYVKTGGRYNPSTQSWLPIPTTGAPSARKGFTPIWTGTELIVWGGNNGDNYNDGARFNPATNTWTAMSSVNAPSARAGYGAVWTGAKMVIWAGNNNVTDLIDGAIYDPSTDTWTTLATVNAPSARYEPMALWLGSTMFIWGGSSGGDAPYFNTGGIFVP